MAGVIVSHPFDTIKSNMQAKRPLSFNPAHLYRGLVSPLLGIGFENAIVFGVYHNLSGCLNKYITNDNIRYAISGGVSGLTASFVVTPVERLKILKQVGSKYNGKLNFSHFYKGFSAVLTREIPGFAIYFTVYENLKKNYDFHNSAQFLAFGAISGIASWIPIYPPDLIKTRVQADVTGKLTVFGVCKDIYRSSNGSITVMTKGLYKGFGMCMLRIIPLHATIFYTMEYLKSYQ